MSQLSCTQSRALVERSLAPLNKYTCTTSLKQIVKKKHEYIFNFHESNGCRLLRLLGVCNYLLSVGFFSLMPAGPLADHSSELLHCLLAVFLGLHRPHPFWAASPSDGRGSWHHGYRARRCRWARAGKRPGTLFEPWHQDRKKKNLFFLPCFSHLIFSLWQTWTLRNQTARPAGIPPSQWGSWLPQIHLTIHSTPLKESVLSKHSRQRTSSTVFSDNCSGTWNGPWMFLKHFCRRSWALSGSPSSSQPIANIPLEWNFQASI